ncbi:hydrolase [Falsibacillus albus]|uniref:Hydrolase n=1 Tax=Falsibacillus albus TaxID=2478915 RepID=A0A3L7KAZ9_9BACI|nr:hydrolase [Falsibacillus albus]RLQ97852.1 hydrolase [Falsibacillus albus]
MSDQKRTYYIEVGSGEISSSSTDSPWNFKIEATDEEITKLREIFDSNYATDEQGFFRSHVPYIQYHYDRENDAYDRNLQQVYQMIHDLGDEEARNHIESMGILDVNPTKDE